MLFLTEAQRLAHPLARQIPSEFFYSEKIFNSRVEEDELVAMTAEVNAMDALIIDPSMWASQRQYKYWLCFLIGHPAATTTELLHAAHRFSLAPKVIFMGAILTNRLDLLEGIDPHSADIQEAISYNEYALFRFSSSLGYLETLQRLVTLIPVNEKYQMLAAGGYDAFRRAARNGHLPILNWLKIQMGEKWPKMLLGEGTFERWNAQGGNALGLAASQRRLDVLEWLRTETTSQQFQEMIAHKQYAAFCLAIESGDISMLEWFERHAPSQLQAMIQANHYSALSQAASAGHVHVLEWLKAKLPEKLKDMISAGQHRAFCNAAMCGRLAAMQWLKAQAPEQWEAMMESKNQFEDGYAFSSAAYGHIAILNWFKTEASAQQLQILIAQGNYLVFRMAAAHGDIAILDWLKGEVSPSVLQAAIVAHNYAAFYLACEYGYKDVLNWLKVNVSASDLKLMIAAENFQGFLIAAENGHVDTLNWLKSEAPEELYRMIWANKDRVFARAIEHRLVLDWLLTQASDMLEDKITELFAYFAGQGDRDGLNWLNAKRPGKFEAIIAASDFAMFHQAVKYNQVAVLNWLKEKAPGQLQSMIVSTVPYSSRSALFKAAGYGHMDALKWLKENTTEEAFHALIIKNDYEAFREAAYFGYLDVLKWFKMVFPAEFLAMIAVNNYQAFRDYYQFQYKAEERHLALLNWLITAAPEAFTAMLLHNNFYAFGKAINYKHLSIINRLLDYCPAEHLQSMLAQDNYAVFIVAAEQGDLVLVNRLIEVVTSDRLENMLRSNSGMPAEEAESEALTLIMPLLRLLRALVGPDDRERIDLEKSIDYPAFRAAAAGGHVPVLNRLIALSTPAILRKILLSNAVGALRLAVQNGHLAVVECLMGACTPELLQEIIKSKGAVLLHSAAEKNHVDLVNYFLHIPLLFAENEKPRELEYRDRHFPGPYIIPFINRKLEELHSQQVEWSSAHPGVPFRINAPEKAKLCFYFLKNLIRRNEPAVLNEIRFLLKIPEVRALASQEVDAFDRLFEVAVRAGNQYAARLLLAIPEVNAQEARYPQRYSIIESGRGFDAERLIICRQKLLAYIQRVERAEATPNFSHGFRFFSQSRSINREANYLLAKSILAKIDSGNEPLDSLFANINQQRLALIRDKGLDERERYIDRGMNSKELGKIIRAGL